jgi:hypothetical protein
MNIGPYRINLDALLARIVYRWRAQAIGAVLLLLALLGLGSGLIPPFWKGRANLTIVAVPGASVSIDGRSWPRPVYAGAHTVLATLPDGRGVWADIELRAGSAVTLTLPVGLSKPRERELPPAAPGTHIEQVWWADGAWRVVSVPNSQPTSESGRGQDYSPIPTPQPGQTVAVRARGVERLATLDAYAGLADQLHVSAEPHGNTPMLVEAVYRPTRAPRYGDEAIGTIEVRGWGATMQTLPISAPLTMLRFAPDGEALLLDEVVASGGEQVYLARPDGARVPLVAVPGRITRLSWHPGSQAVVLHSVQGERLTLTLIPSVIAAVIADLDANRYAGSLVPLTWDEAGLLWVAPDRQEVSTLWRAPLSSLIPERSGPMEAQALTCLPDGTLRVVTRQGPHVVIGRYKGEVFIGETTVPGVTDAPDLAGMWQGRELLLQGGGQAWLLEIDEDISVAGQGDT